MIDYNTLGINSKCAFPNMPYDERFSLFKDVGFSSLLLWGGEEETSIEKRIFEANRQGLIVESVHAPYVGNTHIWNGGKDAERYLEERKELVELLGSMNVKTLVLHPEGNEGLPIVNPDGMKRYMRLFEAAMEQNVDVAIENIHILEPVKALILGSDLENIGFCFDSGHANIWGENDDMLRLFGDKLKAIHLHDNDGVKDTHEPLFSGTINWADIAKELAMSSYSGTLTLETKFKGETEKELIKRLEEAYSSGKRFASLLKNEYKSR